MNESVKNWWNANRHSLMWSGAIHEFEWDDLWEDAQIGLTKIYYSAKESK